MKKNIEKLAEMKAATTTGTHFEGPHLKYEADAALDLLNQIEALPAAK